MPVPPSRRLVLTGALTAGMATLTGCGVRLEDDAPDLPFVPTRDPIPGESALLAVLGALEASGEQHSPARADRLRAALEEARVPADLLDAAQAPSSPAETVAAHEGAVRDCGPGLLPLVGRLTATHRIVGSDATLWTPSGTQPWEVGEVAADALRATRATTYALDLIASRSSGQAAREVLATGKALRDLGIRQTTAAGDAVGAVTLGYDVPHELPGAAGRELGTRSFARLLAAYADGFARLGEDRAAALEVTRWMATAERLSRPRFPQEAPELYGDDPPRS